MFGAKTLGPWARRLGARCPGSRRLGARHYIFGLDLMSWPRKSWGKMSWAKTFWGKTSIIEAVSSTKYNGIS